jgi:hypothetical protein
MGMGNEVARKPLFRLTPDNIVLVELLLRLELSLRRYFGLERGSTTTNVPKLDYIADTLLVQEKNVSDQVRRQFVIFRMVLINYLYDAYLRLLISDRQTIVFELKNVGTLTFMWSLARARKLDYSLYEVANDVQQFSKKLDNLRHISNIDILMPSSIGFLERMVRKSEEIDVHRDDLSNPSAVAGSTALLNYMKTYYDVSLECKMFDHANHYDEAFVPSYRFCDSTFPALNMSRNIGNTMGENIRGLYRYISDLVEDPNVCPCVVIFNLFIRDNYRMYHSKSLRQSSFVSIRRTNGTVVKLSYMIVTNLFPRVNS